MSDSMKDPWAQWRDRNQHYLRQLLAEQAFPSHLLQEVVEYALFSGGKRLRPMLIYLTGELLSISPDCLDILAASVELTHTYSLIHDDLPAMDNDDFRRGKLSCHKAFHEGAAILAGDALQIHALTLLLQKLPLHLCAEKVLQIACILCESSGSGGMISGQCLDLYPESQSISPETTQPTDSLRQIHDLKTTALIMACINMTLAAKQTDLSEQ